jgi:hypothetical protein
MQLLRLFTLPETTRLTYDTKTEGEAEVLWCVRTTLIWIQRLSSAQIRQTEAMAPTILDLEQALASTYQTLP